MLWCAAPENTGRHRRWADGAAWKVRKGQRREPGMWQELHLGKGTNPTFGANLIPVSLLNARTGILLVASSKPIPSS